MKDETAYLISYVSKGRDENGYEITEEVRNEIFVEEKGVTRSEFYQAARADRKISKTLITSELDYSGETVIEHDGKRYSIIKSFPISGERVELSCSEI